MKKNFVFFMVATLIVVVATISSCKKEKPQTVTVGPASNELTAGMTGTVVYNITSTNIRDRERIATVANLPKGVTMKEETIVITNNSGTFTLVGSSSTLEGTYSNLTLSIARATSDAFTLKINKPLTPPVFITQPDNQTITESGTATFTASATGNPAPTLQWQSSSRVASWTDITNATSATLTLKDVTLSMNDNQYRCVATNSQGSANSNAATLTVNPTPTYTITATPSPLNFGSLPQGYTQPAEQTVTVKNTGNSAVTLNALPSVDNYTLTALSTTTLAPNATATFTVRPNTGLATGTYNRTISISGSNGASASVNTTFSVVAATYTITATPTPLNFGSVPVGYAQPAAQTVTVKNTGNSTVTLNALPAVTNYMLSALSTTTLTPNATATFTVRPNLGLAAGNYNRTITVTGSNGASPSVNTTFTVNTPSMTVTPAIGAAPRYGSTTFTVATTNINTSSPGEVVWYTNSAGTTTTTAPLRVSTSVSTGSANRTLTVTTGTLLFLATAGTYYFRVEIAGVQSAVRTLNIYDVTVSPTIQYIVGGGSTTYTVTTSIAVTDAASIQWYSDAAGTKPITVPSGFSATFSGSGTTRTLTITGPNASTTYYFRVIINGVQSVMCTVDTSRLA